MRLEGVWFMKVESQYQGALERQRSGTLPYKYNQWYDFRWGAKHGTCGS